MGGCNVDTGRTGLRVVVGLVIIVGGGVGLTVVLGRRVDVDVMTGG